MNSKIAIDFDSVGSPVIVVQYKETEDVRDKLIKRFLDQLDHNGGRLNCYKAGGDPLQVDPTYSKVVIQPSSQILPPNGVSKEALEEFYFNLMKDLKIPPYNPEATIAGQDSAHQLATARAISIVDKHFNDFMSSNGMCDEGAN